ncbi:Dolichol-phosphate mannose synthase subunit 3 [Turnera subulata]|uniref:Dolichol-phosphate mannosyltransferase subunit 3 n=1 Tax=Turnera subulata TaxID=218843 RepID=A0A9Q0EZD1_9ROSI|nr:Dolichol-phosphate mannose synthase subunit 3 [Turnera subulata]
MKHIVKIMTLPLAISAFWIGLASINRSTYPYTWLLPIYFIVSLGCYGLLMVGVGLMQFPTCPQEALLLRQVLHRSFCLDDCYWLPFSNFFSFSCFYKLSTCSFV